MRQSPPPPHLRPSGADPVSALGDAALRWWPVLAGVALLGYQLFAAATHRRTWSRARGGQRVACAVLFGGILGHIGYEWVAEDVARAAAEAF